MKKVLYIDCTMREQSRTKRLATAFIEAIDTEIELIHLKLSQLNLQPLVNDFFFEREELLLNKKLDHPRFDLAHQFSQADEIIIAAPFWDLSFPALLKIYIENVSVDTITFKSTADGLKGICKAKNLFYLTTRGGFYTNDPLEQALPHLKALSVFFGINHFHSIAADGMDVIDFDSQQSLNQAILEAQQLAKII